MMYENINETDKPTSYFIKELKNQGYNVIGLFMRNWDSTINNDYLGNPNLNNDICPQEKDYNDALAVCKNLSRTGVL